ncbi:MAG TPA: hypothetical protein VEX87_20650 [Skermanella sp.]|jgi:hypothetical protein|nr:hypothetical protein [Skermanella sp.]
MHISYLALAPFLFLAATAAAVSEEMSDAKIRSILVRESIAQYSGNCPCPENYTSNGRRCGRMSAWSKAGGEAPFCYPDDVLDDDIADFRARNAEFGIQEVRGGRRSSSRGSWSSPGNSRSAPEGTGHKRRSTTRDSSWLDREEPEKILETPEPPSAPAPSIRMKEAKIVPEAPAPNRERVAEPEVQQLPDCPPGTSLARWNSRNICVGTPESLANVGKPVVSGNSFPDGATEAGGETRQHMTFGDVLTGLQAKAEARARPAPLAMEEAPVRSSPPPATGLLDCRGGTRVTYTDGRIECR